jgi:predicted RNA binding protein YcfA (HicA-like mRNA interferase family)
VPAIGPIKRRDLIRGLRKLGFDGPYVGKRHQFMLKEKRRLTLPNPHAGDISTEFLLEILNQAGITRQQWEEI